VTSRSSYDKYPLLQENVMIGSLK